MRTDSASSAALDALGERESVERQLGGAGTRQVEQVDDQRLHAQRGVGDVAARSFSAALRQGLSEVLPEELAEGDHLAQRLLQVVRGDAT